MTNFEMIEKRRRRKTRSKVVPRATSEFVVHKCKYAQESVFHLSHNAYTLFLLLPPPFTVRLESGVNAVPSENGLKSLDIRP